MTQKEEIERRLLFAIDTNEERDKAVNRLDTFIQEEVEAYKEALEEIKNEPHQDLCDYYNPLYENICNCHIGIAQHALSGKKPDPSRAELVELVKEAWVFSEHEMETEEYRWSSLSRWGRYIKNLKACIKKLEGGE